MCHDVNLIKGVTSVDPLSFQFSGAKFVFCYAVIEA